MPVEPLNAEDKASLALADHAIITNALSGLKGRAVPPWLQANNPFQDGTLPRGKTAFAAVAPDDLTELTAIRSPLHAIDGWSYLARALNALISGNPHAARHLAYYAELRGALSILASSGIGIFNKRNAVIDAAGGVHILAERHTHDMCWAVVSEWALAPSSLGRMVQPLRLSGRSLLDPFREFFPSGASVAASHLMTAWGFDLEQGAEDRDERNWSSYQPTALSNLKTTPEDDLAFLRMFWEALRPGGVSLTRHLLRILLEAEAVVYNLQVADYQTQYDRIDEGVKNLASFNFLCRITEPVDHDFLVLAAKRSTPAHPYSMICRAALLLRLASGMAEASLLAAGIQPATDFEEWWKDFGVNHGLWTPDTEPLTTSTLWDDVGLALEDAAEAPTAHRHEWITTLAGSAVRICEAERAALWEMFQ